MNKISYAEFVAQVKQLQADTALSTDLDLIRNNPHWASALISELLEAAE
jgi:hypothetical protein